MKPHSLANKVVRTSVHVTRRALRTDLKQGASIVLQRRAVPLLRGKQDHKCTTSCQKREAKTNPLNLPLPNLYCT